MPQPQVAELTVAMGSPRCMRPPGPGWSAEARCCTSACEALLAAREAGPRIAARLSAAGPTSGLEAMTKPVEFWENKPKLDVQLGSKSVKRRQLSGHTQPKSMNVAGSRWVCGFLLQRPPTLPPKGTIWLTPPRHRGHDKRRKDPINPCWAIWAPHDHCQSFRMRTARPTTTCCRDWLRMRTRATLCRRSLGDGVVGGQRASPPPKKCGHNARDIAEPLPGREWSGLPT